MKDFDTIWRFAITGFLLAIVVQLGKLEKKFDQYFYVPEFTHEHTLEEPQDGKDINK